MASLCLSFLLTGGCHCRIDNCLMSISWNRFCFCDFANLAGQSLCTCFCTGRLFRNDSFIPAVFFLRNYGSFFYETTVFTDNVSCIAFFTAGCIFCISYFCIRMPCYLNALSRCECTVGCCNIRTSFMNSGNHTSAVYRRRCFIR